MTAAEIIAHCDLQIAMQSKYGRGGVAEVLLLVPGRWGKRDIRRLCPGGPSGEIVEDNMDGKGLRVMFDACKVRKYLTEGAKP